MTIRVGPTQIAPTHHVKLTDRDGNSVGLILCNDKGEPQPLYNKTPIERTALKKQSGGGSYADYNYPYSPIVQDDWSGGRANLDFERDTTRYYDARGLNTRHPNKVIMGPWARATTGYKSMQTREVSAGIEWGYARNEWKPGCRASLGKPLIGAYTISRAWLYIRRTGTPITTNITIKLWLCEDQIETTLMATGTIAASRVTDYMGEWVPVTLSATLTLLTGDRDYKIIATDTTGFEFLCRGSANTDAGAGALYRTETAAVDDACIYYEYKGQQYKVLSTAGAAPTVWINGYRGAADSNAGKLTKVVDAAAAWTVDQWAGCVVKIVQGTGKAEPILYRTITSNTATELTCSSAWTIQHDTTTEYVIYGADTWRELTGHGLTVPVTAVLPVGDVVYYAQGDSVLMRSHREYNNAGTWTEGDWRAEAYGATHLAYQPLANKIWRSINGDGAGNCSVTSATPAAYGTDLSFSGSITVGYKYEFINGLEVYPADNGIEALWVYKEELAYIVTAAAEGIKLDEMRYLRSRENGSANLVHNVYSYFTLGNGLQRYYGGSIDSVGPNLDEGLPADRKGRIVQLLGYPGRIMAIVDGGTAGYSSLLERSGSGWHEIHRAPLGERLKAMALQVIPGDVPDRLWLYQGNMSVVLTIANDGEEERDLSGYLFAPEGAIILSRMHAGMYDVQKLIKEIRIWSDNLSDGTLGGEYETIEVDYRLDQDTAWTRITGTAIQSPVAKLDMTSIYGLAGKRIQLRIRMYTGYAVITPVLRAAIVDAVLRSQVKYMYNITFRVMDDEPALAAREMDEDSVTAASMSAMTKLAQLESWADADTDSLLYMTSNSPLYNGKYVFINPPVTRQIALDPDPTRQWTGTAYVCSTSAQEA
jgi:hypothetical protein